MKTNDKQQCLRNDVGTRHTREPLFLQPMITMKTHSIPLAAFLAAILSLCGCAPQPRQVPFNETAFVPYARSGSATIKGTAFTVLKDNKHERVAGSGATVKLVPANAFTDEIMNRRYYDRVKLEPADPRYAKYVRRTHPDEDGHFIFTHLPPGEYYVSCHLRWDYPSTFTDSDNNIQNTVVDVDQWIYRRVAVQNGQTADVEDWVQGK
jgi:hypothetical protein